MGPTPEMDTAAYLDRIGYRGALAPTRSLLASLHRAHMLSVPFENLDILLGREITLSLASFYDKIVRRRRGGFCYELNGLFGWLLARLGFAVTLLSGRVYDGGRPGPEFDHMVLLVETPVRMIADVGFGDSFREPLPLGPTERVELGVAYRFSGPDDGPILERRRPEGEWEPQYRFSLTPRRLHEFAAMCRHQQTSPDSIFTRKSVCSLATPAGRITLSNEHLIVTEGGLRDEREVGDAREYRRILSTRFGIELDGDAEVDHLLCPARRR